MALQDILNAIIAETDDRIQAAKDAHKQRIASWRVESAERIARRKQELDAQCEEKKRQMQVKTDSLIAVEKRNALLHKKRELLDALYGDIVKSLSALPDTQAEKILSLCLKRLKGTGTIHPAKKHAALIKKLAGKDMEIGEPVDAAGGFVFRSPKQESDYTFEHIVANVLRPKTEVHVARTLFSS